MSADVESQGCDRIISRARFTVRWRDTEKDLDLPRPQAISHCVQVGYPPDVTKTISKALGAVAYRVSPVA